MRRPGAHPQHTILGGDGALRRPRRVERRNQDFKRHLLAGTHSARYCAGGDIAMSLPFQERCVDATAEPRGAFPTLTSTDRTPKQCG